MYLLSLAHKMALPEPLKSNLITALANYKTASDELDVVAPTFTESYNYASQNPSLPYNMLDRIIPIPPDKLAIVQAVWRTSDHLHQLMTKARNQGFDCGIGITSLMDRLASDENQ